MKRYMQEVLKGLPPSGSLGMGRVACRSFLGPQSECSLKSPFWVFMEAPIHRHYRPLVTDSTSSPFHLPANQGVGLKVPIHYSWLVLWQSALTLGHFPKAT